MEQNTGADYQGCRHSDGTPMAPTSDQQMAPSAPDSCELRAEAAGPATTWRPLANVLLIICVTHNPFQILLSCKMWLATSGQHRRLAPTSRQTNSSQLDSHGSSRPTSRAWREAFCSGLGLLQQTAADAGPRGVGVTSETCRNWQKGWKCLTPGPRTATGSSVSHFSRCYAETKG